jgi:hypothetical protein
MSRTTFKKYTATVVVSSLLHPDCLASPAAEHLLLLLPLLLHLLPSAFA